MKKEALKYILGLLVVFFGLLATSSNALGQGTTGVTDKEILIGSCSALEGPSHFLGTETANGAKAYFNMINEAGGLDGRKLRLLATTTTTIRRKRRSVSIA
jgi:ABC-type branched-subunit amino acid transport system substrate-binding protein